MFSGFYRARARRQSCVKPRSSIEAVLSILNPVRFSSWWKYAALLALGVLVGIAFLNSLGTEDRGRWIIYIDLARHYGIFGTYPVAVLQGVGGAKATYPPLALILLALLAYPADFFHQRDFLVLKESLTPFTLGCAWVMAMWQEDRRIVLGVAMFLVLALNALMLAYIDVYFVFFLLLSYYFLSRGQLGRASTLFVVSVLVKWQPIILAPLIVLFLIPRVGEPRNLVRFLPAVSLAVVALLFYGGPMFQAFTNGITEPAVSAKALNFNWLITALAEQHWPDYLVSGGTLLRTLHPQQFAREAQTPQAIVAWHLLGVSTALRYVTYAVSILYFYISKRTLADLLRASVVSFFAYFTFGMAVHENHVCVAAVLALCWVAVDRSRWFEAIVLGVMFNVNLLIFYGISGDGPGFSRLVFGQDATIYLAVFNVLLFLALWFPLATGVFSAAWRAIRPLKTNVALNE